MRAMRLHQFGDPDVLQLDEVACPEPKNDELLVRVHATSLNYAEVGLRRGEMKAFSFWRLPLTLGFDLAGEVVACGPQVSAFLPGDRVYGAIGHQGGANADYACVKQSRVTLAPAPLAFGELAAVPVAGLTALQALRSVANLQEGQRVLVSGASGGVGAFAVQLAKRFGGTVTGVCSGAKRDFVESLGAFDTIDYQKDDFSQRSERWDIIFDASGKRDFAELQRVLSDEGRAVSTRLSPRGALNAVTSKLGVAPRYHFIPARERSYDLAFLARLIERGELRVPLDRTFELKDLPEAHRYMEAGEVCGKVVVKVV